MNRRSFMKWGGLGIGGAGLLSGVYTWQVEPYWLEFVTRQMPIKGLPDHLVGKTLMQISDIHVGNRFDYGFLIESFKQAQAWRPDFVAYTGDYVNYEDHTQFTQLAEVMKHAVTGQLGTVGVLGNHDYGLAWAEPDVANTISGLMEEHGVEILRNDLREIAGLTFIGFDDYWAINFKPENAMLQYVPNRPSVLLCHNPDVCDLNVWGDYSGWILSGHTHGGQCKPPFLPPPMLPVKNRRYTAGEFDLGDGRLLYINRALGNLWPVRFNVRPEITLFELVQADKT